MVSQQILHEIVLGIAGVCGVMLNILSITAVLSDWFNTKFKLSASESLQIVKTSFTILAIVVFIPLAAQDFGGQGLKTVVLQGATDIVEILLFHSGSLAFLVIAFVRMKMITFSGNANTRFTQKWGFGVMGIGMIPAAVLIVMRIVIIVIQVKEFSPLGDTAIAEGKLAYEFVGVLFFKLKTTVLISVGTLANILGILIYVYIHRFMTNEIRHSQALSGVQSMRGCSRSSNIVSRIIQTQMAQRAIRVQIVTTMITRFIYAIVEILPLCDQELFSQYVYIYSRLAILILCPVGDGVLMKSKWIRLKTCLKNIPTQRNQVESVNVENGFQREHIRTDANKYIDCLEQNDSVDSKTKLEHVRICKNKKCSPVSAFSTTGSTFLLRRHSTKNFNLKPVVNRCNSNAIEYVSAIKDSGVKAADPTICRKIPSNLANNFRNRDSGLGMEESDFTF